MVAYSATTDLLTGDIPLPSYISAQKFVDDAADEIDSKIGFLYATPVDLNAAGVLEPVKKLLKRINNFLASGRLLMVLTASQEDDRLHAYAYSLVVEANAALLSIAAGEIPLGLPPVEGGPTEAPATVPLLFNQDEESAVEAFYDRVANPWYAFSPVVVPRNTSPEIIR